MKYLLIYIFFLFKISLTLAQSNIDTSSFDTSIRGMTNEELVIIGESHDIKNTHETQLFMIGHFAKMGYDKILIEGGHSEAFILNKFMKTGDEELLINTRAGHSDSYNQFIKALRKIIQNEAAIEFVGFDFERSQPISFLFKSWLQKINTPELSSISKELQNFKISSNPKIIKKTILNIKKEFNDCKDDLKLALGEDFIIFKKIIYNPVFSADFGATSKKRDAGIKEKLITIESSLKNTILITGSNHITYEGHFYHSFIENITTDLKTYTFIFAYKNCTNLLTKKKFNSVKPLSNFFEDVSENKNENKIIFSKTEEQFHSKNPKIHQTYIVKMLNQLTIAN